MTTLKEKQRKNQEFSGEGGSPPLKFCTLEYRAQDSGRISPILLILLEDAKDSLRFLVHPDWRSMVQPEDVNHINGLLGDFLERAKEQTANLFKQLSSLGVGPLVTDYQEMQRLIEEVSELEWRRLQQRKP